MIPESEIFEVVRRWPVSKKRLYQIGMPASTLFAAVVGGVVVGGLSTMIAHAIADSPLSTEAIISAVIVPSLMAYLFVIAGAQRLFYPDNGYVHTVRFAAWSGLKRGFFTGFVVMVGVHFLAQLLTARAVFGAVEFSSHTSYYCAPTPLLYGLVFAVPVGLGCALLSGYLAIGPQAMFEVVGKLPDSPSTREGELT